MHPQCMNLCSRKHTGEIGVEFMPSQEDKYMQNNVVASVESKEPWESYAYTGAE